MVVLSQSALEQYITTCKPICADLIPDIPTIDLKNANAKSKIVKACEEYGFFQVINHGVPIQVLSHLEDEARKFFNMSLVNKEKAGHASPFGYGNKNIGPNGDIGWIEYILLSASPELVNQMCDSILPYSSDALSSAIKNYITTVKKMAVQVLEMMAEALKVEDKNVFSRLIKDEKSDSYFRLNHYPPRPEALEPFSDKNFVGFGEHTDPQIISVLRSNNIAGLQISLIDGAWVSVPPDHNSFFINVGDSLQVMTNGKFKSVKHRVIADNTKSRFSMIFFGGPPLSEKIAPLPCILQQGEESLYEEFTWREYKKAAYKSRLSDNRLSSFVRTKYIK